MDKIWSDLLAFVNQLVSPDWGSLVALVPILLVLAVALYLVWLLVRLTHAGPTRRGKRRLAPRPPAGVHAAETSRAPVLAAVGCFVLFYGLVFKGWLLPLGVGILALTLLYWLREGMRDYDHVEHPATALVVVPPVSPSVSGPCGSRAAAQAAIRCFCSRC